MQKRFQQLTGHVSEQNTPRIWCWSPYYQWPLVCLCSCKQTCVVKLEKVTCSLPLWARGPLPLSTNKPNNIALLRGRPREAGQTPVAHLRMRSCWRDFLRTRDARGVEWMGHVWGRSGAKPGGSDPLSYFLWDASPTPSAKGHSVTPSVGQDTAIEWDQLFLWIGLNNEFVIYLGIGVLY